MPEKFQVTHIHPSRKWHGFRNTLKRTIRSTLVLVVLAYVLLLVFSLQKQAAREIYTPEELANAQYGKFIELDGAKFYVEDYPSLDVSSKTTLVFIHGLLENTQVWKHQIEYFRNSNRVILVDMPGYGLSQDMVDVDLSQTDILSTLMTRFVKQIDTEQVILIGHSLGGEIAQRIALDLPGKVQALILVDPTDMQGKQSYSILSWANNPLLLQLPYNLIANEFTAGTALASTIYHVEDITPEVIQIYYKPLQIKNSAKNFVSFVLAGRTDRLVETGKITMPVLLIYGQKDTVISETIKQNLKNGLVNAELAEIPDVAHVPQLEDPAVFNQLLDNWLNRLSLD